MAIERISLRQLMSYHGIEDMAPPELQPAFMELVKRLQINADSLFNDLESQVVVDTSVLPAVTVGEAADGTKTTQTNTDVEQAMLISMLM